MNKDFETYIAVNKVPEKSVRLWWAVKKVLENKKQFKKNNGLSAPHLREYYLDSKLTEVWNEIQRMDGVIKEAILWSLNEHEINQRPSIFSNDEEKEQSANNQLIWKESFVQSYAYLLAEQGKINELNELIDNLEGPENNLMIMNLVHVIELIQNYKLLLDKKDSLKSSRTIENIKKDNEIFKGQIELLKKQLTGFSIVNKKLQEQNIEIENQYDEIFKDSWSYSLFLEMVNKYVNKKEQGKKARISYVYWVLKHNKNCIYDDETKFLEFIRGNYISDISRIQAPSKLLEFDDINHVKQLKDIQKKFSKKFPRRD